MTPSKNEYGLSPRSMKIISAILSDYSDKIDAIKVCGSRAMNNYKDHSDLDLVLYGRISEQEVRRLYTIFHESSLAIQVDIAKYESITYLPFRRHIDEQAIKFTLDNDTLA